MKDLISILNKQTKLEVYFWLTLDLRILCGDDHSLPVRVMPGEEETRPGLTKFPGKLQGLVMSKAGLVAAANWLLGPLSFKKQIHGMDCNGNG